MEMNAGRVRESAWMMAVADVTLGLALAWSVFAIGGTLPWAVVGLLALTSATAAIHAAVGRFRLDAGALILFGLGAYTALQSVHMPITWLQWLDPVTGETWARTYRLLQHSGGSAISLEPLTTRYEAVRFLCYGLTWAVVSERAKQDGPLPLARWIAWLTAAVAAVTVLHRVLGVQAVYGVYTPRFSGTGWVGPLLNPNNLGGLCNLGVFCALACASRRRGPGAPAYFALAACLGCLTILTGSRGASVALLGGLALFGVGWMRARNGLPRVQHWGLAYAAVALLTLVALTIDLPTLRDLTGNSVEKVALLRWGLEVSRRHPWFGVGMGAFGSEVSSVSGNSGNIVFPYVECFPLDAVAGWGLPLGVAALVTLTFGLFRIGGGFRTYTMRLGVGVVLLQNLMDLGLQVPGLMVPTLTVFAACWGGATRKTWALKSERWSWGVAVGAAVLGGFLALPIQSHLGLTRDRIASRLGSPGAELDLERALLDYPGDAYLLRARAAVAVSQRSPDALSWVNAALLRAPANARTHLLLARVLLSRGNVEQALGALRGAAQERALQAEVVRLMGVHAPGRILDVAPEGNVGASFLTLVAGNSPLAERVPLLEAASRRAPASADVAVELATAKILSLTARGTTCTEGSPCHTEVAALVSRAETLGAAPRQMNVLRGQLRALGGDQRGAFESLLAGCERSPQGRSCLNALLDVAARLGKVEYEEAARAFLDGVCVGTAACPERMTLAQQFVRQGSFAVAHQLYARESSQSGLIDAYILTARLSSRLGREREAWHWLQKAEQHHRADPSALARLAAVRAELGGSKPALGADTKR